MKYFSELVLGADTTGLLRGKKVLAETRQEGHATQKSVKKTEEAFDAAGRGAKRAAPHVKGFNNEVSTARAIALGATKALAGMAVGYASFQAAGRSLTVAREFNSALAETSTLIEGTPEQLDQITESARNMAKEFGGSATSQVQAFYQALSAGADGVSGASVILDQANRLAIGGATDVTTATGILSGAINSYGKDVITASEVSDALFVGMKTGVTTVGELSGSLGAVIPTAKSLGISFDEVVAATAALTKNNLSTSVATTSLNAALVGIIKPSKDATDVAKALGIEFNSAGLESKGLAGFLADVVDKTGGNVDAMSRLFGSVEALKAALLFAGEAGGQYNEILAQMEQKAGATDEAYAKMAENLDQRWNKVVASAGDLVLVFGNALLSVVVPAMETAAAVTLTLSQSGEELAVILGALALTQVPALIASMAAATAGITLMEIQFIAGAVAAKLTTGAITVLRGALIALGGPIGIVFGLLGAAAGAMVLFRDEMGPMETAAYDAEAGSLALAEALDAVTSAEPESSAAVIALANNNVKLANSSYEAAKAELAKRRAMLDMRQSSGANGSSGSIRSTGITETTTTVNAALERQIAAEKALDQVIRDRSLAQEQIVMSTPVVVERTDSMSDASDAASEAAKKLAALLGEDVPKGAGSTSKAASDATKELEAMAEEMERLEFNADPVKKYNKQVADLNKLMKGGLSPEAYATELERLNDELISSVPLVQDVSNAFGDWVASGLQDFDGFVDTILSSFKNMLSEMASTAFRNKILIPITAGITGGGTAGAVAGQAVQGGGGVLGSLSQGAGGLLGGIGKGFSTLLGSFSGGTGFLGGIGSVGSGFLSGGLSGGFSAISGALSGATSGLAGFGAALGAIALPLAAVAGVFSFFSKKTKELDAGLRITVNGLDSVIETFSKIQTKRFWGLSKKVRTHYTELSDEAALPFINIIDDMATSIMGMGEVFGFAASNIDNAALTLKISTKGMSDEEAEKAIEEELTRLADVFADAIVGTFDEVVTELVGYQSPIMKLLNITGPLKEVTTTVERVNEEFEALKKEGEGSFDALTRLTNSILTANSIFDTLGLTLYDVTLQGAGLASELSDLFGGLDEMSAATTAYYAAFYTEQERIDTMTRQLTETLGEMGLSMPKTRDAFRQIVEAQDLSTEAGRRMFASLVSLSAQVDAVLPAIDSLSEKIGQLASAAVSDAVDDITSQIAVSKTLSSEASRSAEEFARLAESLRGASAQIGGVRSATDLISSGRDFAIMMQKAMSGDTDALGSIGSMGTALATESASFARSQADLIRTERSIQRQLEESAAVAETLGLGADYQSMILDVETAALEELRDLLQSGNITQDLLNEQLGVLAMIRQQIVDSASLQVQTYKNENGVTVAAIVDNGGNVVGALSEEGARATASLQSQTNSFRSSLSGLGELLSQDVFAAMDQNGDSVVSAIELTAAQTLSSNQSTVVALASAIDRNGSLTTAQIRSSLAGKASDASISAVINAVDRNKDGIVTAEEAAAARTLSGLSQTSLAQIQALTSQTGVLELELSQLGNVISRDVFAAMDQNGDTVVSALELSTARTLSSNQSTVVALASAIDRNGSLTTAQIRSSLAGKASDASISAVISAVDRNKDGIVTAEEAAAARTLSGLSQTTVQQLQALSAQSSVFSNAITGQTGSITGEQSLTNDQLSSVQDLQGETVSITELVERAVAGNETLTSALLNRMTDGISVAGITSVVSGLDRLGGYLNQIASLQQAAADEAAAEAHRQAALAQTQRQLEETYASQVSAITEVEASSAAIAALARQYGIYMNAQSGAVQLSQTAQFGVNDQGLFEAKYGQISYSGSSSKASNFKNEFYSDGGLYDQTYGRAAELRALAEQLEAQRQAIIDLGGVPAFMSGGMHSGGARWAGEGGPELELTGSSRILNAQQSRSMVATGNRRSEEQNQDIYRALVEIAKYTKRTSDTMRRWEAIGPPQARVE